MHKAWFSWVYLHLLWGTCWLAGFKSLSQQRDFPHYRQQCFIFHKRSSCEQADKLALHRLILNVLNHRTLINPLYSPNDYTRIYLISWSLIPTVLLYHLIAYMCIPTFHSLQCACFYLKVNNFWHVLHPKLPITTQSSNHLFTPLNSFRSKSFSCKASQINTLLQTP